jgi:hypothetical protein
MYAPLMRPLSSIASRKSLNKPLHSLIGGGGLLGKHFLCRMTACMTFGQRTGYRIGRIASHLSAGGLICPKK